MIQREIMQVHKYKYSMEISYLKKKRKSITEILM